MQSLEEQLQAVTAQTLTGLISKSIDSQVIEVVDWSFEKIHLDHNPITAGVYRFSGTARTQTQLESWSLVLKVLHWVDLTNQLGQDLLADSTHVMYWKREGLVFQSGIVSDCREGIIPVQCYGVAEPTANSIWLWLEDVQEADGTLWNLYRHIEAARHFGEFNGAYIEDQDLGDTSWLANDFLRQVVNSLVSAGVEEVIRRPNLWSHPALQRAFPFPIAERILQILDNRDALLTKLAKQSQSLSHQDTDRRNLFSRRNSTGQDQTIAIDWGFLGLAAVGEDLGNQVLGNLYHLEIDVSDAHRYQDRALEAYMEGLRQAGYQVDLTDVRFASAAQALQYIALVPWVLNQFVNESLLPAWAANWAQKQGHSAEETLERWGKAIYAILDAGDKALQLMHK